jgi:hypothetical protein
MTYHTTFILEHDVPDEDLDVLLEASRGSFAHQLLLQGSLLAGWHDHEKDMLELSRRFPDSEFTLEGEGEGEADHWKKRFIDDETEEIRPSIVWPEFQLTLPD